MDMFISIEIVELLEWSILQLWGTKFDLDGYVPMLYPMAKLIQACEVIKRNDYATKKGLTDKQSNSCKKGENGNLRPHNKKKEQKKAAGKPLKFCEPYGQNPLHNMLECYTLKNCTKVGAKDMT